MPSEPASVSIEVSRAFKRHSRSLSKKYHHIRSDIQPTIDLIELGEFPGDRIQGIEYVVFKVRARNRYPEREELGLSDHLSSQDSEEGSFGRNLFEARPRRHFTKSDSEDNKRGGINATRTKFRLLGFRPLGQYRHSTGSRTARVSLAVDGGGLRFGFSIAARVACGAH